MVRSRYMLLRAQKAMAGILKREAFLDSHSRSRDYTGRNPPRICVGIRRQITSVLCLHECFSQKIRGIVVKYVLKRQ